MPLHLLRRRYKRLERPEGWLYTEAVLLNLAGNREARSAGETCPGQPCKALTCTTVHTPITHGQARFFLYI